MFGWNNDAHEAHRKRCESARTAAQAQAAILAASTGGEEAVRELAAGMSTEELRRVLDQLQR
ncbi:hypothetical protein [Streptomyces albidoflavus]|uniref:hypothetical protein n=1 Tax=Streptomyces albidoflavus TaxID=1886 RepID=UPI0022703A9F|nr:hypothetical protein [Streptomyces albidoflavus]CAI4171835.1 putative protein [Streptomyces albidoflavus]